ncbi:hypothetical protein, partial [Nemorincola caseinilytica]|uniref:beta strand repeat-containing protein n=1 Tax=Nemorincola caseinilytica TaxID=2054315 RepID=UPI0031EC91D4
MKQGILQKWDLSILSGTPAPRKLSSGLQRYCLVTILLLTAAFLPASVNAAASECPPGWSKRGDLGFTSDRTCPMKMDRVSNTPYIAVFNTTSPGLIVRKYNGSSWVDVGSLISSSTVDNVSIEIYDGTPYVMYSSETEGALKMKRYNSGSWEDVGTESGIVSYSSLSYNEGGSYPPASMTIDATGRIYVAYATASGFQAVTNNEGSWEPLGSVQAAHVHSNPVIQAYGGIPYVAYFEADREISVKKLDGDTWTYVGDTSFSAIMYTHPEYGRKGDIAFRFNSSGVPYIAFTNYTGAFWMTITNGHLFSLVDGEWSSIAGMAYMYSLTMELDDLGTPYMASGFFNWGTEGTRVYKFNGTDLEEVGTPYIPRITYTNGYSLAFNADNRPLVSRNDPSGYGVEAYEMVPSVSTHHINVTSNSGGTLSYAAEDICEGHDFVIEMFPLPHYSVTDIKLDGHSLEPGIDYYFDPFYARYVMTGVNANHTLEIEFSCLAPSIMWAPYVSDVYCYGENTGAIYPNVNGEYLSWEWSNGYTTPYVWGLPAGTYTYTASNECGSVTEEVTVHGPEAPLSASAYVTDALCYGSNTGSVEISASGGTYPYYPTGTFEGLPADSYYFTVYDNNGCYVDVSAIVEQPSSPLSVSSIVSNVLCNGGITGSVSVSATGGTSPYSGTGEFTGLTAGEFSYTVTDNNGCTATTTGTVSEPEALSASKTITDANCFGQSNGSVLVSATGGTTPYSGTGDKTGLAAGPFSYTVTDANGCTSTVTGSVGQPTQLTVSGTVTDANCFGQSNGSVLVSATGGTPPYTGTGNKTGLAAGPFSYTVTDAHGCTATVTGSVGQPTELMAYKSITNVLCYGNNTGSVTVSASGGTSPYSGTGTFGSKIAGTYNYTVTDDHGCTADISATVSQPASPLSASNTVSNVLCKGGNTGSVSVSATGGTSPYSGTGNFTGKAAGPFSYTVTDNNGCTATTTGTVSEPAMLIATRSITDANCYGESNGSVLVGATGGTTPYSGTGNKTGLAAGPFSYTVTDANGCTSTASGSISEPTLLTASKSVTDVLCYGNNTGSVTVSASGGTSPYSGTGTYGSKIAGTYNYTVTDSHGCTAGISATVSQPAGGLTVSSTVSNVLCYGGNTGSVTVIAEGGVSPYEGTGTFSGKTAGAYSYTVTDGNGCTATTTGTVGQPTQLVANKTVTNVRCKNENNGIVIIGATGGTSPYSGTGTFSSLSPATYNYTVTDDHGCTSNISATVTEPALLVASNIPAIAASGFNLLCNKGATGSTNVTATGGTAPYYNTGVHGGMTAGDFEFFVTDSHGCIDSTSGSLTQPDPFYISTATSDDTICNGESVTLTGTGGVGTFTWYANNGISTITSSSPVTATPSTGIPTVTVNYKAIGYNGFGCPSEPDTVDVTVLPIGYFTGATAVCTDFSVDLDNGTPGGVWSTPDTTYIVLDQNGLISANHKITTVSYPAYIPITYTMPNGCYRTRTETVHPTPDSLEGPNTVCPNSSIIISETVWGGVWSSSNTAYVTVAQVIPNTYNYGRTTGIANGSATVSYTMPGSGCYVTKTVTVEPLAAITGLTNTCVDNTIQLSHPKSGSLWSSSATAKATVNNASGLVTGVSTGSAIITYMVNPTCYVTHTVNVNTTPTPITGIAAVCENATTTLANTVAGGTWSSSSPATGS